MGAGHSARSVIRESLFGGIAVCIPSAALEGKGALGNYFFGFSLAFRAFNMFGTNSNKFFDDGSIIGALKFINRHCLFSPVIPKRWRSQRPLRMFLFDA
jgi:hypothetical protein